MPMKIILKDIVINKALQGKLTGFIDGDDEKIIVEFPETTVTFSVEKSEGEFVNLVGKNINIDTTGVVTLAVKQATDKPVVNKKNGCSESMRNAFIKGL